MTTKRNLKTLIFAILVIVSQVGVSHGFDSDDWHDKRELFAREAERLKELFAKCKVRATTPANDVMIPVETFDDGSVKVMVSAAKAQYFLEQGLVWAENVVVTKYNEDRSVEVRIDAKNCIVDKNTKSGWSDGRARVIHGKMSCQGKGIYFSAAESYIRIYEESKVESKDLKFGGLRK